MTTLDNSNLHQLVENGIFEAFKRVVDLDINLIDSVDDYGRTPLIICSSKKSEVHFKIARYLLDCGCDVNIQANYKYNNWTALMTACYFGNFRMIELIMSANPNLELQDIASNTAWQIAFDNSYRDCVNFILAQMETRQDLEKQLHDAVFNNDVDKVIECVEKKIDAANLKQVINSTTSGNHTLLYRACRNGNAPIVRILLEHGAIARPHYYTKYSPLYIACHMGNVEITKMILEKFPHLIQVSTIEKFLPFHAACSQGHLDVLELLLRQHQTSGGRREIYTDTHGNRYVAAFDLNACDVNEQTGLYAAVAANKIDTVRYLLEVVKVRRLTDSDCERIKQQQQQQQQHQQHRRHIRTIRTSPPISTSKSVPIDLSSTAATTGSPSFFEQLKSVFMDTKSYDPYVVNFTSNPIEESIAENTSQQSLNKDEDVDLEQEDNEESGGEYFNPFNVDAYSKFGTTCLHEAIRIRNFDMVELLLNKGRADPNLPVLETNTVSATATTAATTYQQTQPTTPKSVSNCICEAIKLRPNDDEKMFMLIFPRIAYSDTDLKMCLDYLIEQNDLELSKKYVPRLLALRITDDGEHKLTAARTKISSKLLAVHGFACGHDSPGLVLAWSTLEPKLVNVYESYLLESIRFYKRAATATTTAAAANMRLSDELSFKKLHIYVVTRLDLSSNALDSVPFCLFQMEALKSLKLSNNFIRKLPLGKNPLLDDFGSKSERFRGELEPIFDESD